MKTGFNSPIATVAPEHVLRGKNSGGTGSQQPLQFDIFCRLLVAVDASSQLGGLLHSRESDLFGGGVKGDEASGLQASAIELDGLSQGRFKLRGKKRVPTLF